MKRADKAKVHLRIEARSADGECFVECIAGHTVKASGDWCHQRPLLVSVVAAVCYSPTLFRVQYHCRAGS